MRYFSSRQVVAILVTICVTIVLVPSTVWAASSSLVRLTDGKGRVAMVDSKGRLAITDGSGPLTVGTVGARMSAPAKPFYKALTSNPTDDFYPVYATSSAAKLYVTSINVGFTNAVLLSTTTPSPAVATIETWTTKGSASKCYAGVNITRHEKVTVSLTSLQSATYTYPTPLVLSRSAVRGTTLCVVMYATAVNSEPLDVQINGFTG